MKNRQKLISVLILVLLSLFVTSVCLGSEPVKIKGFFIGMGIDDALKNFQRLGFEGLSVRETTYRQTNTYYVIQPGSGDPFKVETALNEKTVSKIYFSGNIADRLFHTSGISALIFKDYFMKAYGIPTMDPYKENPGSDLLKAWEYSDLENGCRIRIYLNKEIEIIRTDRLADFSFD